MTLSFFFVVNFAIVLCKGVAVPATDQIRESLVQVPFGDTVTLLCESNDANHMFLYWFVNEKNIVIGPYNEVDVRKFRYEVLSGNLTVKKVGKSEEGTYNCVSRNLRNNEIYVRSVRMTVQQEWEEVYEHDSNVNLFRAAIVLSTLVILSGIGYAGYKLWKSRFRHPSYLSHSQDDDSSDEIFPGTSRDYENKAMLKTNSTDSFETPGISTDFSSILDTRNNK